MIPKIVHRVVPRQTTDLMDRCWESVIEHTPGWEHITHYDNGSYTYVGEYLDLCPRGAFRADLIRLEVLYKYGGVYLDSDVLLFKSIDSLLENKAFLCKENDSYIINTIIGAESNSPHIWKMIEMSIEILKSGGLSNNNFTFFDKEAGMHAAFGPFVAHQCSVSINEITKLPSENFITYFGDKDFMINKQNELIKNPNTYGQHIYAGSWL